MAEPRNTHIHVTVEPTFKPGELMTLPDGFQPARFGYECDTEGKSGGSVNIDNIIGAATDLVAAAERWLDDVVGMEGAFVDEVALQFKSREARQDFLDRAVMRDDIEHFNADEDWVQTSPISSRYRVRYDFLRIKGKQFRLECMEVLQGISPLHIVKEQEIYRNEPAIVHVSFKVANRHEYKEIAESLESAGAVWAQGCASTYGIFSYWSIDGEPGLDGVYVKPRVNTRDAK